MKYCIHCGTALPDETMNFCPSCGTAQTFQTTPSPKQTSGNSAALITLCILTILGSVFGILKGLLVQAFYSESFINQEKLPWGYASALFNLGTLAGAILMLNKQKSGYIAYMIFQCANIITVIFWALGGEHFLGGSDFLNPFLVFSSAVTVLPSLVFIVLYTFLVRKELR